MLMLPAGTEARPETSADHPQSGCATHTMRWAVTTLVCSILSLIGLIATAAATGHWTGPSFTVLTSFLIIHLFALVISASVALCCKQGDASVLRTTATFAASYCVVALLSIIVWSSTIDTAAKYNCSFKLDCDVAVPSEIFGCDKKNRVFLACSNPDVKDNGGDYYFSRWGDDCEDDGGSDDACRAFTSKSKCVSYENPLDDDLEDCEKKGTTITEAVEGVAAALSVLTALTLVPAFGLAACVFLLRGLDPPISVEAQVGAYGHVPPTASAIELGTITPGVVIAAQPNQPPAAPPVVVSDVVSGPPPIVIASEPSKF